MIRAIIFDYWGTLGSESRPYDGVTALLEDLRVRGLKLGLLTRTSRRRIEESGLMPFFDLAWVERMKTDDEFRAMATEFDIPLRDTLLVGDSSELEIATAERIGARSMLVTPGALPERLRGMDLA